MKTQPQIAQLEVLFAEPLVKDSVVNLLTDLINLNPNYNYLHKVIWVKEKKCYYFLNGGNGTDLQNWKKINANVTMGLYNYEETYDTSECVYLSGKIYIAKTFVPEYISPLNNEEYWLCISGETETYRYIFNNISSIIIYIEIRNPKFEVILCDIVTDWYGNPVISEITGLVETENEEKIETYIKRREDLENDNGIPYEISFYENSILSEQVSGIITVK